MRQLEVEVKLYNFEHLQFEPAEIVKHFLLNFFESAALLRAFLVLMEIFHDVCQLHMVLIYFAAQEEADAREHEAVNFSERH